MFLDLFFFRFSNKSSCVGLIKYITLVLVRDINSCLVYDGGRCGRDGKLLDLQVPVQSVPITTKVVSSNTAHGEVYSIFHYVIKFVTD